MPTINPPDVPDLSDFRLLSDRDLQYMPEHLKLHYAWRAAWAVTYLGNQLSRLITPPVLDQEPSLGGSSDPVH